VFDRVTEHTYDIEHLRKRSSSRTLYNIRSEDMARSGRSAGQRSEEQERRILGALNEIQSTKQPNWAKISREYRISRTTLYNRYFHCTQGLRESHVFQQKLSKEEEEEIVKWVKKMGQAGMPPRRRHLVDLVGTILGDRADHRDGERVGKRFTNRFLKHHPELRKRLARPLSSEWASATDFSSINHFIDLLADVKSRFKIHPQNIWNADEKGFSLGVGSKEEVICESLNHCPCLVQDGNREWVTLIESASAKGNTLPPFIICEGKTHRFAWHNYEIRDEAAFARSSNEWTDQKVSLSWLKNHFDRYTRPSTKKSPSAQPLPPPHRLLILDNLTSHDHFYFLDYCLRNNIHVLFFPSHSSHILQPLDVSVFSPLRRYYMAEIDEFTSLNGYYTHITWADMFPMVQRARKKALTKANITHGFEHTGIYPFNRRKILSQNLARTSTPSLPRRPGLRSASAFTGDRNHDSTIDFLALRLQDPTSDKKQLCTELLSIAKPSIARATIAENALRKMEAGQKRQRGEGGRRILSCARVIGRKEVERARKRLLAGQVRRQAQQRSKINKRPTSNRPTTRSRHQHPQNSDTIWANDTEVENAIDLLMVEEANSNYP